jgi:two-component system LytT family response regulator
MIRTLIIDDEALARARIQRLLGYYPDFQVVGQASNGREGLRLIQSMVPDLLFLDIQMPDMNGFDMLNISEDKSPFVVFSTAYSQYALDAFNADAIDYLLKPYDQQRFEKSLEKARKYIFNKNRSEDETEIGAYRSSFQLTEKGFLSNVDVSDIMYISAYGNYVKLHTKAKLHVYRSTMNEIMEQLDPSLFMRVHRSTIVNVGSIDSLTYFGKKVYKLRLGEDQILSGRKYAETIKRISL